MGGTIVCGVGETAEGRAAAEAAGALRARLGSRLVLVSVLDGPEAAGDSVTGRQRQSGSERKLQKIAAQIGDSTETRVAHGNPADALAQVAAEEGADVIVVGSRPVGFGSSKLRSGVARELEAVTPVPVLVAPPSTRKRSEQRLAIATEAYGR